MKMILKVLALLAAAALSLPFSHQLVAEAKPNVSISVDSVSINNVGSDRVLFNVNLSVTSDTNLKTKRVQFERMRLGSMPMYLNPVVEHLQLEKGASVTLPSIPLTVFFRDLDSLAPLQQAVREGSARVTGNAHVDLDLNLLERLTVRQWTPTADMPIAVTAPVEVPGGFLGQAAAMASLTAAQFALDSGGSVLSALRVTQRAWEQELKTRYLPSMVIAESRYALRTRDNQTIEVTTRGLGFRISEDKFVLTDEMVQPWKYDPEVMSAIGSGKASLVQERRELLVSPSTNTFDAATARSLTRGQIRVDKQFDKSEVTYVPTEKGTKAVKVLRRDADNNYAVLRFTQNEDKASAVQIAPEDVRRGTAWDQLAMFFVDHNGQLELVSTSARRQDKQIQIEDPIDNRGFGSLLIAREGAVGMVQDERLAMVLRTGW